MTSIYVNVVKPFTGFVIPYYILNELKPILSDERKVARF